MATEIAEAAEAAEAAETPVAEEEEDVRRAEESVAELRRRNAERLAQKRAADDADWAQWSMYDPAVHRVAAAQPLLGAPGVRPGTGPGAWLLVLTPGAPPSPAAASLTLEPGDAIHYRMQEFLGLPHTHTQHAIDGLV